MAGKGYWNGLARRACTVKHPVPARCTRNMCWCTATTTFNRHERPPVTRCIGTTRLPTRPTRPTRVLPTARKVTAVCRTRRARKWGPFSVMYRQGSPGVHNGMPTRNRARAAAGPPGTSGPIIWDKGYWATGNPWRRWRRAPHVLSWPAGRLPCQKMSSVQSAVQSRAICRGMQRNYLWH